MKVNISGFMPESEWATCVAKAIQAKKLNKEDVKKLEKFAEDVLSNLTQKEIIGRLRARLFWL